MVYGRGGWEIQTKKEEEEEEDSCLSTQTMCCCCVSVAVDKVTNGVVGSSRKGHEPGKRSSLGWNSVEGGSRCCSSQRLFFMCRNALRLMLVLFTHTHTKRHDHHTHQEASLIFVAIFNGIRCVSLCRVALRCVAHAKQEHKSFLEFVGNHDFGCWFFRKDTISHHGDPCRQTVNTVLCGELRNTENGFPQLSLWCCLLRVDTVDSSGWL